MTLTFADTHNMIAYLTKSDASEGFNQIIDFLNGNSIKYPLTINPNIYIPCIKQFWTSVAVKKVNDITRLQALVDKKKVKTSCDLSSHTTKYSSPALTQKVFANIRRVGKGCFGVETSFFEGMIVEQTVGEGAAEVNVDDVPAVGVAAEEQDKIAQALEITKLKQRVKKLERRHKASKLKRLQKGRMIVDMDVDVDVTLKDVAKDVQDAKIKESSDVQERQAESQA
uniref:Xylulose kinase-1 n=1 Tax=Tanacetum cinerariifolium TaxID=118510 RepID=A0A699KYD9_TANCI|nr:hypothetical protein [Tanacetum cinerariifolium]